MKKFAIVTDTACDLEKEFRDKYDIKVLPMHLIIDGQDILADLDWKPYSAKEYYDLLRAGKKITTAQISNVDFKNMFEGLVKDGYDVIYIACSSALSAGIKASYLVRDEVLKNYPDAKIYCIDSLRAVCALGNLVLTACELREQGKTVDEVASWLEENKLTSNLDTTVDSLAYLKRAGRVSAASAFFGGLFSIKPIIIEDGLGQNFAIEKVKGRKQSMERVASRFAERFLDVPHQNIVIRHADCIDDAITFKAMIEEKLGDKKANIHVGYVGPIIGATAGPGMITVAYYGKEENMNKKDA